MSPAPEVAAAGHAAEEEERVRTDGGRLQRSSLFSHDPELLKLVIAEEDAKPWQGYDPRFGEAGEGFSPMLPSPHY